MELHCSQTSISFLLALWLFETPMELHCSQTCRLSALTCSEFETPMELHCSQTTSAQWETRDSLRPLWNYTALKHLWQGGKQKSSLRPLWNYTALKQGGFCFGNLLCLRPLWNYTALKQASVKQAVRGLFETPMELHCSQTSNLKFGIKIPKTTCNCLR